VWTLAPGTYTDSAGLTVTVNNSANSLPTVIDSDPKISYGFGITNDTSAPVTYTMSFPATPLVTNLPAGQYTLTSTFGGSVTDGDNDGATLSPASGPIQKAYINGTDVGTPIDLDSDTTTVSAAEGTGVFGRYSGGETLSLTSVNTIDLTTSFTLSPGDSVSFSGSFDVEAVPEPSSVALGAVALAGFAYLARRRQLATA
jgi:hypothetical protein